MLAIEDGTIRSYDGGWAEYARAAPSGRRRAKRARAAEGKRARPKPAPAKRAKSSELEQIEVEIATREEAVAELERQLAEDWANVEMLAEHRRARDELQALLARWEELFERR